MGSPHTLHNQYLDLARSVDAISVKFYPAKYRFLYFLSSPLSVNPINYLKKDYPDDWLPTSTSNAPIAPVAMQIAYQR
jgi:hypothetical protein